MGELLNKRTLAIGAIMGLGAAAWGGFGIGGSTPEQMPERTVAELAQKHLDCVNLDAEQGRQVAIKGPTEVEVTKFDKTTWLYYFEQDGGELHYGPAAVAISQPLPEGDYSLDGISLKVSHQETGKIVLRLVCEPPMPR